MKDLKLIIGIIVVIIVAWFVYSGIVSNQASGDSLKIGVITPMTGGVAYWGESSSLGVRVAEKELKSEGYNVEFVVEDGKLDPKVALDAAQKLVNVDTVDAIYSEFNPAAISVSSFLKDKNVLHLYNAAPVSPLKDGDNIYKAYLDYEKSCSETARVAKNRGVEKMGVLKINLEFGELCLRGVESVYGKDNTFVEEYSPGETDFRTHLLRLKDENVDAVFNASFQPETLASLKNMRELGMKITFIGLSEIVSPDIIDAYSDMLEGSIMFGIPSVSDEFIGRVSEEFPDTTVSSYTAVAMAYIHTKQLAKALDGCKNDLQCAIEKMDKSPADSIIGFVGFNNHIAEFNTLVQEWKNGKFIELN